MHSRQQQRQLAGLPWQAACWHLMTRGVTQAGAGVVDGITAPEAGMHSDLRACWACHMARCRFGAAHCYGSIPGRRTCSKVTSSRVNPGRAMNTPPAAVPFAQAHENIRVACCCAARRGFSGGQQQENNRATRRKEWAAGYPVQQNAVYMGSAPCDICLPNATRFNDAEQTCNHAA